MGFTFMQGRNFSPDFPADSNNFIITEKAANYIGFADPIGQTLQIEEQKGQIIGVIQDFHNLNIHETMHPTVFTLGKGKEDFGIWSNIFIRYKDGSLSNTLDFVTERYKSNSSGFPIQYGFVDQDFEEQFKIERMISDLSLCFTILAVIISCLGLFGLASFTAERRAKEIGIRKVLGASVTGLVILLCKDFTRLVIYSIILGSPIVYYLMELFFSNAWMHVDDWGIYTLRKSTSNPDPLTWPIITQGTKLAFCLMDYGYCSTYNQHSKDTNGTILTNLKVLTTVLVAVHIHAAMCYRAYL